MLHLFVLPPPSLNAVFSAVLVFCRVALSFRVSSSLGSTINCVRGGCHVRGDLCPIFLFVSSRSLRAARWEKLRMMINHFDDALVALDLALAVHAHLVGSVKGTLVIHRAEDVGGLGGRGFGRELANSAEATAAAIDMLPEVADLSTGNGFEEVVFSAATDAFEDSASMLVSRHHDDREGVKSSGGADGSQKLGAAKAGHGNVREDELKFRQACAHEGESLTTGAYNGDSVATGFKQTTHDLPCHLFIVCQQHMHVSRSKGGPDFPQRRCLCFLACPLFAHFLPLLLGAFCGHGSTTVQGSADRRCPEDHIPYVHALIATEFLFSLTLFTCFPCHHCLYPHQPSFTACAWEIIVFLESDAAICSRMLPAHSRHYLAISLPFIPPRSPQLQRWRP
jgi:hypothetical protein